MVSLGLDGTVIQLDFDNPIVDLPEEDLMVFEFGGTADRFAVAVGDGSDFSEFRTYQGQSEFQEGGHWINPASIELSEYSYLPSDLTCIRVAVPEGESYRPDIAGAATIPEPSTLLLLTLGGLAVMRRRPFCVESSRPFG